MDGHTLIALAILAALVILCVAAMGFYRRDPDHAIKILAMFVGLFGAAIGAMGTYFFTDKALSAAQQEAAVYKTRLATVSAAADNVVSALNTTPMEIKLGDFKETPRYQQAVQTFDAAKLQPLTLDGAKPKK